MYFSSAPVKVRLPLRRICHATTTPENAANEYGKAVQDECDILTLKLERASNNEMPTRRYYTAVEKPRCSADDYCPMTMGYYIGGGQFICWWHALILPGYREVIQARGEMPEALQSQWQTGEARTM